MSERQNARESVRNGQRRACRPPVRAVRPYRRRTSCLRRKAAYGGGNSSRSLSTKTFPYHTCIALTAFRAQSIAKACVTSRGTACTCTRTHLGVHVSVARHRQVIKIIRDVSPVGFDVRRSFARPLGGETTKRPHAVSAGIDATRISNNRRPVALCDT